MGHGANIVFPVSRTDRGVSAAPYGNVIAALGAVTYSFGFWAHYEVVQSRILQAASLINPAGNVVHPSSHTVVSAVSDFGDNEALDLMLGIF